MARLPRPVPQSFYERPVLVVAKECIGKLLVHRSAAGTTMGRIVETEAYRGPEDRAAHSFGGRRTPRNEVMWGPAGFAYVFFVYGLHHQFNLVTTAEGKPHAVLVRALEPVHGLPLMADRRGQAESSVHLTNGPGKLCQAMSLDRSHNGVPLTMGDLFLADGPSGPIERSRRIGIDYAGEWTEKLWRFSEKGNRYVSRRPKGRQGL